MTKWSQSKNTTPRRHAHKALAGVKNGHITKTAVIRLARKAGETPGIEPSGPAWKSDFGGNSLTICISISDDAETLLRASATS